MECEPDYRCFLTAGTPSYPLHGETVRIRLRKTLKSTGHTQTSQEGVKVNNLVIEQDEARISFAVQSILGVSTIFFPARQ